MSYGTINILIISILFLSLVGCSSIATTVCEPSIYGGTKLDADFIAESPVPYKVYGVIDILPSIVMDTIFLVFTIPYEAVYEEHERESCMGRIGG